MTHKIVCPKCRKQKSGDTRHGFKVFALIHGVRCSAEKFTITHQLSIDDFVGWEASKHQEKKNDPKE